MREAPATREALFWGRCMHFDDVTGDSGICESLAYRGGYLLLQFPRFLPRFQTCIFNTRPSDSYNGPDDTGWGESGSRSSYVPREEASVVLLSSPGCLPPPSASSPLPQKQCSHWHGFRKCPLSTMFCLARSELPIPYPSVFSMVEMPSSVRNILTLVNLIKAGSCTSQCSLPPRHFPSSSLSCCQLFQRSDCLQHF